VCVHAYARIYVCGSSCVYVCECVCMCVYECVCCEPAKDDDVLRWEMQHLCNISVRVRKCVL
jgi:hypothetical protein